MENKIYQTNIYTAQNILYGIFIGSIHLLFVFAISDLYFDLETHYLGMLLVLIMFWIFIMQCFKKFTLTENEFRVEYPKIPFLIRPLRIPLNDIQKLVFNEGQFLTGLPFIQIYRASTRRKTEYSCRIDYDELKKLINALKSKGVQVECVGRVWK